MVVPLLLGLRKAFYTTGRGGISWPYGQGVLQQLDGAQLFARAGGCSPLEGGHQLLQSVGDTILWGDGRLRDVVVSELGRVGRYERLGELGDCQLSVVVFQGDSDTPTIVAAEIPGLAAPRLDMNDHIDAEGTKWRGAIIELFPCKEVPR